VFDTPKARRARRNVYLIWLLTVVLIAIIPAIGAGGLAVSRISFGFILIALPIVFLFQWWLERWVICRAIRQVLQDERQDRAASAVSG
jgi:hypothetical protein